MTHDTDAVPSFRRERSCFHVALLTCRVPSPSLSHISRSLSVEQMNESAASRIVSRMPRSPPTAPSTSCSTPVAISAPRHCQDHRCKQRGHTYTSTHAHRKAEIGPSLTDRANRQHLRSTLCARDRGMSQPKRRRSIVRHAIKGDRSQTQRTARNQGPDRCLSSAERRCAQHNRVRVSRLR